MILTDAMIQAALDLRKTRPWDKIVDGDIFAIKLANGETGYCSVSGDNIDQYAFNFHEKADCLTSVLAADPSADPTDMIQNIEFMSYYDSVTVDFEETYALSEEEIKVIKKYSRTNKTEIPSPFGWPQFIRMSPGKVPFFITREQDANNIVEAMKAATYIAIKIGEDAPESATFCSIYDTIGTGDSLVIPLLTPQPDGSYKITATELPKPEPKTFPTPLFEDKALTQRILALPKGGLFQGKACLLPIPVFVKEDDVPFLPEVLVLVELKNSYTMMVELENEIRDTRSALKLLAEKIIHIGKRPSSIIVADEKTRKLLTDFCKQCNISLCMQKNMDCFDAAFRKLADSLKKEMELDSYKNAALQNNAPRRAPMEDDDEEDGDDGVYGEVEDMPTYSAGGYPRYLERPTIQKYTLRITLRGITPAIWRKITVPSNMSLRLLSELILDLMGWENEHLNSFSVGRNESYMPSFQRDDPDDDFCFSRMGNQEDYTISDVLKVKGKSITFEYDFGDNWNHEVISLP